VHIEDVHLSKVLTHWTIYLPIENDLTIQSSSGTLFDLAENSIKERYFYECICI
jgi:hypothetical protein